MGQASSSEVITLPKGGGALHGMGETFSPDLHTGTGNCTMPLALPPGRNGFQPQLNLVYSTGNGNGPFGLGWHLSIPGVSRKTSKGVPRYDDAQDVFILSGAEDLVPVKQDGTTTYYRPRTEGLFAEICYHRDATDSYWEVRTKDGLKSFYGTKGLFGTDPATIADPSNRTHVFAWKLTRTEDSFGNRIEYEYARDSAEEGPHHWDQVYLKQIRYADYEANDKSTFLVSVHFEYEERRDPDGLAIDPFSDYRSGFEIRTRRRCARIVVRTHADTEREVRSYEFLYLDQRPTRKADLPINRVSLLSQVRVTGHDGDKTETLPPLEFTYTRFAPEKRTFFPLQGADLPVQSLANPNLELVDLFGNGLPDFVEMNGTVRYWRNLGNGRFDLPRFMPDAPAGLALSDAGVQFIDANGDGRTDLLVTTPAMAGYFPLRFSGQWDRKSFQRFRHAPSFNLEDPEVKLVDLDGDGVTDAIRSGSRLECFFNDPEAGWKDTRWVERQALDVFPNVNFSDPRVKWGDMSGDGLQDLILVYDGSVDYWPNLGYGNWGARIHMQNSPRLPYGYAPRRILVGDVDGDGLADIVYIEDTRITLWINQSGNRWSDPITIQGTPPVSDSDAVRLVDLLGSGISGVLWSRDANGLARDRLFFHDFTGGLKPYLLDQMDNHMGAVTKVEYAPSTHFYLEDQKRHETRWKTTVPFPVHVVARVEVLDHFSQGKLAAVYRYHHGHWDGAEREFRGFGMVEQLDTEAFETYDSHGLHGEVALFARVDRRYFSPPTLTRTWFHQGPVGDEYGDWEEQDYTAEYWQGDPQLLGHTVKANAFLSQYNDRGTGNVPSPRNRRLKRDALRTLRGSILRTELYALDGSDREQRPYTVTEHCYGLREESELSSQEQDRLHIFFPHQTGQRTTQWERGDDPLTQFVFPDDYDAFGQPRRHTRIACPRGWRTMADTSSAYLATRMCTVYAKPLDQKMTYIYDRVAKTITYEVRLAAPRPVSKVAGLADSAAEFVLIGQAVRFYDGDPFVGLANGSIGAYGALTRSESLVLTEDILTQAYGIALPPSLLPGGAAWPPEYPAVFRSGHAERAGYTYHAGDGVFARGYWVATERRSYDFHDPDRPHRGLMTATRPPLGVAAERDTRIAYDVYDLLPNEVTDPAGLKQQAQYNYRVLQPEQVTDPNGNHAIFTFTPLGLLETSAVKGRAGEGDDAHPSVTLDYDFRAFERQGQPVFVRSSRRVHHDSEIDDVPVSQRHETIETREYSDGFGRLLQTRVQAEDVLFGDGRFGNDVIPANQAQAPGPIIGRQRVPDAPPNVVVSGWQTYDNKGQVVEKWEPYFDQGWDYDPPDAEPLGAKVTMFYDPRGHVVRTVNPDDSEQRVIFGVPTRLNQPDTYEPTPWEAYTYDANDNAGRTHRTSARAYEHHWDTPTSIAVDGLGRTVETVERNRVTLADPMQEVRTRMTYDIRGNLLTVTDALDRDPPRPTFRYVYDLANRTLRMDSIDTGVRQTIFDAGGNVVEQRDGSGALILHAYDVLNRPIGLWARNSGTGLVTLRERLEYGDGGTPSQLPAERAIQQQANRLGKLHRHYDEAGLMTFDLYDFKGNLLDKTRRVVKDAVLTPSWTANWETPTPDADLDPTVYQTTTAYDALNRIKTIHYPQDVGGARKELWPEYNRAGALQGIRLDDQVYVRHIAYNARGQRTLVIYGNEMLTAHAYAPQTFRLQRLWTGRFTAPAGTEFTYHPTNPGQPLQDFGYDYDLAGNIWAIHDRAPSCGLPAQPDMLDRAFTYDALYRLLTATGRECNAPPPASPWDDPFRCHDVTVTRFYKETYQYDDVGNLTRLQHSAGVGSFTRDFTLAPVSNRLHEMHVGTDPYAYQYDPNGNMIGETTSRHFDWDYSGRMTGYRTQPAGGPASVEAQYLYDASGQRVKKVRKQGGQVEVTVYIDGLFEHHIQGVVQNNSLHIMDNQSRIALVRIGPAFPGDGAADKPVQYHLGDHLGSSSVVVGGVTAEDHDFVNREEYTPYGETSFGSYGRKRYRFSGKERDEESGLSYFGARYYAAWVSRWMSCDPAGLLDGLNLYMYVENNPVRLRDPAGLQSVNDSSGGPAPALPQTANTLGSNESPAPGNLPSEAAGTAITIQPFRRLPASDTDSAGSGATTIEEVTIYGQIPKSPELIPTPEAADEIIGHNASSAGGTPTNPIQTIKDTNAQLLAKQYPALASSIYGAERQETFITEIAPLLIVPLTESSVVLGRARGAVSVAPVAATEVTAIETTNARIQSLLRVAESGDVKWLAGDERLYAAYQDAMAAGRSTATGREGFNLLRERLSSRLTLEGPIHHWRFPITQYESEARSAENLYLTGGSAHLNLHRAIGLQGAPYSSMAWGAERELQSMFNFWLAPGPK